MFGLGPIELLLIGVSAFFVFVAPIVVIVVVIRLVATKDKSDRRPGD